jgi:hypothetical protein
MTANEALASGAENGRATSEAKEFLVEALRTEQRERAAFEGDQGKLRRQRTGRGGSLTLSWQRSCAPARWPHPWCVLLGRQNGEPTPQWTAG